MAIAAMLQSAPNQSAAQIDALPNICPCGAYPRIRKAILRAEQAMSGAVPIAPASPPGAVDPAAGAPASESDAPQAVVPEANRFSGG